MNNGMAASIKWFAFDLFPTFVFFATPAFHRTAIRSGCYREAKPLCIRMDLNTSFMCDVKIEENIGTAMCNANLILNHTITSQQHDTKYRFFHSSN